MCESDGWKLRRTRGMVGCTQCSKTISISKEKVIEMNGERRVVISETSEREQTYYQKGKKRLCADCYESNKREAFIIKHLGKWLDEGDRV